MNLFLNSMIPHLSCFFILSLFENFVAKLFHVKRYHKVNNEYNTIITINTQTPGRCHAWKFLVYKKVIYRKIAAIINEKSKTSIPSQPTWVQKVIRAPFCGGTFISSGELVSSTLVGLTAALPSPSGESIWNWTWALFVQIIQKRGLSCQDFVPFLYIKRWCERFPVHNQTRLPFTNMLRIDPSL